MIVLWKTFRGQKSSRGTSSRWAAARLPRLTHLLDPSVRYAVEMAGLMGLEHEQFQLDDPELRKVFTSDAEPDADIEALRTLHPGLRTSAEFVEETERRADRRVHGG